jgi:RNA polymerase sigma factor
MARTMAPRRADVADTGADAALRALVGRAQGGDGAARERLLERFASAAVKIAARAVRHDLHADSEDEASVALIALNEAIDRYDPSRGARLLTFAQTVIRRRLIDQARAVGRPEMPLSALELEDEDGQSHVPLLSRRAVARAHEAEEAEARREEIARYAERLGAFGLTLAELWRVAPRHRDSRRDAQAAGRLVASDAALRAHLMRHRLLPMKALEARVRVTRKTLERHRKYIVAVALVSRAEFPYLYDYLRDVPAAAGPNSDWRTASTSARR